jgi:hypothetical protein
VLENLNLGDCNGTGGQTTLGRREGRGSASCRTDHGASPLKSSAQKNLAVTYDFVQKLTHAKNFNDIIRIQTDFVQTQLESFGEQAKSIGEAVGFKAATWYERRNTDTD